jgi:protein phosphatase
MPVLSAYKNDPGLNKNRQNEDFIWVDDEVGLYIVADGMGGHEGGEIASELAATTAGNYIAEKLKKQPVALAAEVLRALLLEAGEAANQAVFEAAHQAEQERKMGTTLVMALIQGSKAYISHAGDSRAYWLHNSTLRQLTEDDSWSNFVRKSSGAEGQAPPGIGHILTKAVGQNPPLEPSFSWVELAPGDMLLLCSDGLWNMVQDELLLAELAGARDRLDQAVEKLVAAANAAGGKDNISVVLVQVTSAEN